MTISERDDLINLFDKYKNTLTQTQKQYFHLHYLEDLSFAEIASIAITSRSAIHDAVTKASKKLIKINQQINES